MQEIFARRSVRKFTPQPVTDGQITQLLKAAMRAPSAGNEQPWHFVVLQDRAAMQKIIEFHPYATMLNEAACAIVVCGDTELEKFGSQYEYWVQDCSAATQNLLLEAVHLNLGAVWCAVHPVPERVDGMRALLGLPQNIIPLNFVAVGHPQETPAPLDTYKPERVHFGAWDGRQE